MTPLEITTVILLVWYWSAKHISFATGAIGNICQRNGIKILLIPSVNISANIYMRSSCKCANCTGSAIRSQCQILDHIGIGIGCHWWSNIPGLNLFSHFFLIIYLNDPRHCLSFLLGFKLLFAILELYRISSINDSELRKWYNEIQFEDVLHEC